MRPWYAMTDSGIPGKYTPPPPLGPGMKQEVPLTQHPKSSIQEKNQKNSEDKKKDKNGEKDKNNKKDKDGKKNKDEKRNKL